MPRPGSRLDCPMSRWTASCGWRKAFQRTVSIVRRHDDTDLWREVKFRVFDVPAVDQPFEERASSTCVTASRNSGCLMRACCRNSAAWALSIPRRIGPTGLTRRRRAHAAAARLEYESGRSTTLLKVKRFHDAEARVIEHQPGGRSA